MSLKFEISIKRFCILYILLALLISALSFQNSSAPKTFAVPQAQGADYSWPMYLHDPQHTGYTESPVPRMPTILWNYTMGGQSWGPVVAYGKVFLGSTDKKVYAFNQTTGEKIWEFTAGKEIWAVPAIADSKVFIGSLDGKVYALEQASGKKMWEFDIGAPIGSSPIVNGNIVYIGSLDGKVYALDKTNGGKIWEFTTGGAIAYSSPAIAGDLLFIGSCDGYLYALKKDNGREEWRVRVSDGKWYIISSPAASSMKVFIGSAAYNKTYAFYHTGSLAWEYTTGSRIWASPSIAYDKVFISSLDGKVYALDQNNGAKIWEFNVGTTAPSLAVADEMVIVPSSDGKLYALNQSSGSKVWDITVGGARDAGTCPVIADGKIYVMFGNTLYAITSRSTLTISLSQTRVNVGSTIIVSGRLSPARLGASIMIQWRGEGETTWRTLATVTTDAAGHYAYDWRPEAEGSFELRAYWGGDASTLASQSDTLVITIEPSPPPITMKLLIAIIAAVGVAVALIAYVKRRPK